MELLPLTPKIQRKFPMTEPLGEPTGPIDLFGRGRDSAQALSIATRRAAGLDRRISAMTFAGMGQLPSDLDIPASQMAYPMMRAEALGQISVPTVSLPPGMTQDYFQTLQLPEIKSIIYRIEDLLRPGTAANYSADQLKREADREMAALKAVNAAKLAAQKKRNMALARKLKIQEDIQEILVYMLMNNLSVPTMDFNLDQFRQVMIALDAADRAYWASIYAEAEKKPAVVDAIKRILNLTDPKMVANLKRSPANLAAYVKDQDARRKTVTSRKASPMCMIPNAKKTRFQLVECAAFEYEEELRGAIVYLANNNFQFPAGISLDLPEWLESKLSVLKTGPARSNLQGLGQIPQLLRAERLPLMLNPNLGLKMGLPGELNRPPSQLAVPQIRREANLNVSPAEAARQFRLAMDRRADNMRLAGLGAGVGQAPMSAEATLAVVNEALSKLIEAQLESGSSRLNGLGAMVAEKLQIPDTAGAYDAEAFSSNYVDRIKAGVRIDYGEQQYAGYANAARAAQYQSPAFVGASYNYPEAFMRRGISLAGGLGSLGQFDVLSALGIPKDVMSQITSVMSDPVKGGQVANWAFSLIGRDFKKMTACERYDLVVQLLNIVNIRPQPNMSNLFGCQRGQTSTGTGAGTGTGTGGGGGSGGGLNTNRGGGTAEKKIPTWVWVASGVGGVAVLGLITYLAVRK